MKSTDNKENIENLKNETNHIVNLEDIKKFLEEAGIHNYEPEVVTHLNDYINHYAVTILNCATTFMKHAGRDNINVSDVNLAIGVVDTKTPAKRLSFKDLIEKAHEQNKEKLPECSSIGIPLPKNDYALAKCNYKLKNSKAQFSVGSPMLDLSNRNKQIITLNSNKHHSGTIPTVVRTSAGTVSVNMPMNLAPQRIILKQPTFSSFNKMNENINKRHKLN